ncbi:hypothetical protein [Tepidanaerobacter syntrophicus]|uniref:Uncharacterized protein n=1 Tax=Tepidanaerobacter syntrophicus TaxID=224999 RepID=A0A0U9HCB6_9FIRM|nr:hypothetical protein [Tepidanaerobacter syntrophicus]GAQ24250.1 hypothetical protein TSYNT_576 [Tepidanaerobacter syntrophicus]
MANQKSQVPVNQANQVPINKDPEAIKALKEITNLKGKLDLKGMAPFLVNMGGKPYVDTGGLKLKLQEVANKRKGIKSILTIMGSYAHEAPQEMLQLAKTLPAPIIEQMCKERDNMAEMFTAPKGTAVAKCIIIFGDGLKVEAKATASLDNIQMSTIKPHADVMAQTRAFNRCVRYITANGFLDVENMIREEEAEDVAAFEEEDSGFFPREDGGGDTENSGAHQEPEQSKEGDTGEPSISEAFEVDGDPEDVEPESEPAILTCSDCGKMISKSEKEYSEKFFKKQLCMDCQTEVRQRNKKSTVEQ